MTIARPSKSVMARHPICVSGPSCRKTSLPRRCYTSRIDDITIAPDRDQPRPVATAGDNDFTLSIEQVSERYAVAGHPRTIRTLQRYCASGHLNAQKIATSLGDKYLVTPLSLARHIAQIQELGALYTVATSRDRPRHAAMPVAHQTSQKAICARNDTRACMHIK
jgi:hypothetical protein